MLFDNCIGQSYKLKEALAPRGTGTSHLQYRSWPLPFSTAERYYQALKRYEVTSELVVSYLQLHRRFPSQAVAKRGRGKRALTPSPLPWKRGQEHVPVVVQLLYHCHRSYHLKTAPGAEPNKSRSPKYPFEEQTPCISSSLPTSQGRSYPTREGMGAAVCPSTRSHSEAEAPPPHSLRNKG